MIKNNGIYCIINMINQNMYIGSSKRLKIRKSEHFSDLRYNKHSNQYLQNSYNKYTKNNFKFFILEYVKDNLNLSTIKQYYIYLLKPDYNIQKIAYSNLGFIMTEEQKLLRSLKMTGKKENLFLKNGEII